MLGWWRHAFIQTMDTWFWSLLSSDTINSSMLSGRHSKSSVMVNIIPCTTATFMDTISVCSSWLQAKNESTLGVTVGQQFYTLQLLINCRKSWWPTNLMNHPRARVTPLSLPWEFAVLGEFFCPSDCVLTCALVWSNRAVWKCLPWSCPLDQCWLGQ